jgi:hypothetical protein
MNQRTRLNKTATERLTFELLAPLIDWRVVPGTIVQPNPPQPDILCEIDGCGPRAVELVTLDHPHTRRRSSNMFGTRDSWRAALARWPQIDQQALVAGLRNAGINVFFENEAGTRDRAEALYQLQAWLLAHPDHVGTIPGKGMGAKFQRATVHRFGGTSGPHITAPAGDWWRPPDVANLIKHLQTMYEPHAPLELFAYSTDDEPDGSADSLATIQDAVAQYLPTSRFQRVHVFHVGFKKHIWSSAFITEPQ